MKSLCFNEIIKDQGKNLSISSSITLQLMIMPNSADGNND